MPTARELLEQADALMRRNRGGVDIPVLTDVVSAEQHAVGGAGQPDIPVLTDQVEEALVGAVAARVPSPKGLELVSASILDGDPSDWLVMDTIDPAMHSVTGSADTLGVVPPLAMRAVEAPAEDDAEPKWSPTFKAAGSEPTPPPAGSGAAAPTVIAEATPIAEPASIVDPMPSAVPASMMDAKLIAEPLLERVLETGPAVTAAPVAEDERWRTVADQISMQVLQRIDLFTDTGLKEQLAQHLQPIVARAGAELVTAINDHVGKLLRAYVAEAIEREIAQWRREHD
jgi:hypothetical protein